MTVFREHDVLFIALASAKLTQIIPRLGGVVVHCKYEQRKRGSRSGTKHDRNVIQFTRLCNLESMFMGYNEVVEVTGL